MTNTARGLAIAAVTAVIGLTGTLLGTVFGDTMVWSVTWGIVGAIVGLAIFRKTR
jgi:hypothetical protein